MRVIAISLSKGGVGKTTTAVNLAAALATMGKRVLLVDTDTQNHVGKMLGISPDIGLDAVLRGQAKAKEAVTQARENLPLYVITAGETLAAAGNDISKRDYGREWALNEALSGLNGNYDYCIMDTAPGWDALAINAFFFATEILIPVSLEVMSVQSLTQFIQRIAPIKKYRPELVIKYILPTFDDKRVKRTNEIKAQLTQYFPDNLCEPIRTNVRLSEAPGYGQTIFEYAPLSPGAEDYKTLAERIMENGES